MSRRGRRRQRSSASRRRGLLAIAAAVLATVPSVDGRLGAQAAESQPTVRQTVAPPVVSTRSRAAVVRRPASAVALALGDVGGGLLDADVLFYNPAMLTQARGVAASVQREHADASHGALAGVQSLGALGVGVGARIASWRGAPPDEARFGGVPRSETATSVALTAGAARAVGPLRVGLAATYAREAERDRQREHTTFDVGATLPFGPGDALNASVIVQHLGRPIERTPFDDANPWRALIVLGGRNYPLATYWDLSAFSQVALDADGTVRTGGGAELAWVPLEGVSIALRGGLRDGLPIQRPLTAGLGLSLDRWSLDYALDPRRDGRTAHRLGVRIR